MVAVLGDAMVSLRFFCDGLVIDVVFVCESRGESKPTDELVFGDDDPRSGP